MTLKPAIDRIAREYDDRKIIELLQSDCGLTESQAITATAMLPVEVKAHADLFWILDMACIEHTDGNE